MASGQIRMTPDTMRERAGEYRTEADNVQSVIDKMDRLLDTLLTEWEGSALIIPNIWLMRKTEPILWHKNSNSHIPAS